MPLPGQDEILNKLASYLRPKRVEHSRNVAQAAVELARRYAPGLEERALVAGLVHDNAKGLSDEELLEHCARSGLAVSPCEQLSPKLLHGKVGAALLPERFGIKDKKVTQAVCDHVTGRPGMKLLSRLLYVADQAAADRNFTGVEQVREVATQDLDSAVWLVARHKVMW
jgi:predicted HD superfamily hydrolase involved in NAD metabolism